MIITNGKIITPTEILHDKCVTVTEGIITSITDINSIDRTGHQIIDADGGYILPGLIDIHSHGGNGSDFMDCTYNDFVNITRFHASRGITSLVATSLTSDMSDLTRFLESIRDIQNKDTGGCIILGAHLEGPFLSMQNKGAHPEEYILAPKKENYGVLLDYSNVIKSMTVSPDSTEAINLIKDFSDRGVVISGGHDFSFDEMCELAVQNGMTHTTHIFCVMSTARRVNGKKVAGLTEFALYDDRLTVEIIADRCHVPSYLAKLAFKCKGPKKMCLVSDCLNVTGFPKGNKLYVIGPKNAKYSTKVLIDDLAAVLPDRSLNAGSITTIDKMIRNMIEDCDISIVDAVRMASLTPAEIIGVEKSKGSIQINKDADFCVTDSDLNVKKTIVNGKFVFEV